MTRDEILSMTYEQALSFLCERLGMPGLKLRRRDALVFRLQEIAAERTVGDPPHTHQMLLRSRSMDREPAWRCAFWDWVGNGDHGAYGDTPEEATVKAFLLALVESEE